jgi:hypothetical protein
MLCKPEIKELHNRRWSIGKKPTMAGAFPAASGTAEAGVEGGPGGIESLAVRGGVQAAGVMLNLPLRQSRRAPARAG